MNYRERMREYLKEPDDYSSHWGKWGILNYEQRSLIKRLLNEMDGADEVIKKFFHENQQLKDKIDKIREILNQPLLNYASCVKALDEIEEVLKGEIK